MSDLRINRRRALLLLGGAAGSAALAGCGSFGQLGAATATPKPRLDVPDATIGVRAELIAPKETDPAIDAALEPHYVAAPSVAPRGQLFLFLHGTNTFPDDYRLISDQAARNGFHAASLRYLSAGASIDDLASRCQTDPDPACSENARLEQLDGTDRSTKVKVSRANSIENRLLKLLAHLQSRYPNEGWANYVDGVKPRWSAIVAAGHSQGANHAALIAKHHALARVVMLSGPADYLGTPGRQPSSTPAPWLVGAHATPSSRYYAFGHVRDELYDLEVHWKAQNLGLTELGPITRIDRQASPYGGSHLLVTEATPGEPKKPASLHHASPVRDDVTPKGADGQPLFAPVWQYMAFA